MGIPCRFESSLHFLCVTQVSHWGHPSRFEENWLHTSHIAYGKSSIFSEMNCSCFILIFISFVTRVLTSFCSRLTQTGTQSSFLNFTPSLVMVYIFHSSEGQWWMFTLQWNWERQGDRNKEIEAERELKLDIRPLSLQVVFKLPLATIFFPACLSTILPSFLSPSLLPFSSSLFISGVNYWHRAFFFVMLLPS